MTIGETTDPYPSPASPAPVPGIITNGAARNPWRDAWVQVVKETIWRYVLHFEPRRRPICLYGSRRSGSTLLMETIGTNRHVMFSDQPFAAYTASRANLNRLPVFPYGQIAYPDAEEERSLQDYFERVLSGEIRANVPWKIGSPEFHRKNDRLCLKITDAKLLIDWIDARFQVDTIVLTRHPIAQALSVANAKWMTTGKGLLRNASYVEQWLTNDLEAYCWDIYRSGSDLMQRIADWALENMPLLAHLKSRPHWIRVSLEELILSPQAVIDHLTEKLQLTDRDLMLKRLRRPSRSTKHLSSQEQRRLLERGDCERLLSSWRTKITAGEMTACFELLQRFHIDLYRADSDLPNPVSVGRTGFY